MYLIAVRATSVSVLPTSLVAQVVLSVLATRPRILSSSNNHIHATTSLLGRTTTTELLQTIPQRQHCFPVSGYISIPRHVRATGQSFCRQAHSFHAPQIGVQKVGKTAKPFIYLSLLCTHSLSSNYSAFLLSLDT